MSAVIGIGWWIGTPVHPARMGWSPAGVTLQGGLHTCLWSLLNHATWEITPRESGGYIHVLVGSFLAKIATFPLTTTWTQRLQKVAVMWDCSNKIPPICHNQFGLGLDNSCHASHFANIPNSCHTSHFANIPVTATNCFPPLHPVTATCHRVCVCCNDKKKE